HTLDLSGPTGHGFQIAGDWTETITPVPGSTFTTSTYTATSITLKSAVGDVPLTVNGSTPISITPVAHGYNGLFGEVASGLKNSFSMSLGSFSNTTGSLFGLSLQDVGGSVTKPQTGLSWGIALGSDPAIQNFNGAFNEPVNPAVPYIYMNAGKTALGASFGQIQASKGNTYTVSAVVDPTAPWFYIDIQGIPVVNELAFGGSLHAEIPYTPLVTPTHWTGNNLYGDLYFKGAFNIQDIQPEIPV